MFSYTPNGGEGEAEVALRRCKTEHYYPSSPLPRTLRRPGSRVEEDAMAKTKNPGNYGQGPLTPTLPPFNPRRDLSPDSWFSTFISPVRMARESCPATFYRSYPARGGFVIFSDLNTPLGAPRAQRRRRCDSLSLLLSLYAALNASLF